MAERPHPQNEVQSAPAGLTLYPIHRRRRQKFLHKHSLSIVSIIIVIGWIVAYCFSDPNTHLGSFFGNAIADWSGVVVTVLATKWLYEKNSRESRTPPKDTENKVVCAIRDHSLSIFLVITGIGWVVLFAKMETNGKWGQVVGNIVSEWTQIFGMVLLTKRLIEWKSKD
jgi:peptidoglycan/LPS O-acetylase OafA/YrhL